MSVQDLRSNSQDASAFYLANIHQTLADPNITVPRTSIPSALDISPPFTPPAYTIWMNSLWFLSFVISLTCGLLATMLRQWSHRYVWITQPPRYSPEKRARMRAFFSNGVDKMRVPLAVETLPLLHPLQASSFVYSYTHHTTPNLFNASTRSSRYRGGEAFRGVALIACQWSVPAHNFTNPYKLYSR
jgi:hypothetical protein